MTDDEIASLPDDINKKNNTLTYFITANFKLNTNENPLLRKTYL